MMMTRMLWPGWLVTDSGTWNRTGMIKIFWRDDLFGNCHCHGCQLLGDDHELEVQVGRRRQRPPEYY